MGRLGAPVSVPSLQSHRVLSQQDQGSRGEQSSDDLALLARQAMVQHHAGDADRHQEVACVQDTSNLAACRLVVCLLTGKPEGQDCHKEPQNLWKQAGGSRQRPSIPAVGEDGQFGPPCMEYHQLRLL